MRFYDELKRNTELLKTALGERERILNAIEEDMLKEIKGFPPGRLHVRMRGRTPYYYIYCRAPERRDTYIRRKDSHLAKKLAQREYLEKMLPWIREETGLVSQLLTSANFPDNVPTIMLPEKLKLVDPIYMSDEEFTAAWQSLSYKGKPFGTDDNTNYITAKGVRVRSRAEVMIADRLTLLGIPYHYEFPVMLKGWGIVYADFACLNIRERRVVLIEHLGMLSNPEYLDAAIRKINDYEKNDFRQGVDIIYTFESANEMINMEVIEILLRKCLL